MAKYNEQDWCSYTDHVHVSKAGRKIRCPACRKRMIPRTLDAEPNGPRFDPYYVIPRHKKPHGRRKAVTC